MASRNLALAAAMLALSGGAAFAQLDDPHTGFFANPVLPSPARIPAHIFPASLATADVAHQTPAAGTGAKSQHVAACNALNPCAIVTPAARG